MMGVQLMEMAVMLIVLLEIIIAVLPHPRIEILLQTCVSVDVQAGTFRTKLLSAVLPVTTPAPPVIMRPTASHAQPQVTVISTAPNACLILASLITPLKIPLLVSLLVLSASPLPVVQLVLRVTI